MNMADILMSSESPSPAIGSVKHEQITIFNFYVVISINVKLSLK